MYNVVDYGKLYAIVKINESGSRNMKNKQK